MEVTDSMTVLKHKLNTGTERKDRMILQMDSICNWGSFLENAPTSIAILGHLMAISTQKDFSLNKQPPEEGFKYVKYPGSFRACLVQISNSGCDAFMNAHQSMDKIHMYTMQFQESIKYVVNILIKGSDRDRSQILPSIFEDMKKDANQCHKLATATKEKFYLVMLLLLETSEASAAVKGVYEKDLQEALAQMQLLEIQEKQIAAKKLEMEIENNRVIEELSQAKAEFEQSVSKVPGIGRLLLMHSVEEGFKIATGALDIIVQSTMATSTGGLSLLSSLCAGNTRTSNPSHQSESQKMNDDKNQSGLNTAYQYATQIHVCIEQMYEMFKEETDSNEKQQMKVDLGNNIEPLKEIKTNLVKFINDFDKSEFTNDPAVLETKTLCKKGIELCDKMLNKIEENADEIFQQVEKLKGESKGLQLQARQFFRLSSVFIPSITKQQTNQKSQSKRLTEMNTENAMYEVELRKKELNTARIARERMQDEMKQMDEKQNSVLEGLSKTKINSINFEKIQRILSEGLKSLSQLQTQWGFLVIFFQNITNRLDICLSQKTCKLDGILDSGGYNVDNVTRDIVLEMAASVNCVAYSVGLIARAYTDISEKHLVPNMASLVELISYDPVNEETLLNKRRDQINDDCKRAKDEISALSKKSRQDMQQKIDSMYERLEEQLSKLPPLSQEKVQEIKQNVEKSSSISASDYI